MDCSPLGSFVHGILQVRILEWVAMLSSRGSSQPRDGTQVSCIAGRFSTAEPPGKPKKHLQLKNKKRQMTQLKWASQCRRHKRHGFDPWAGKTPWSRKWHCTPVFLPEKFLGQRSLVGYSKWGHKESDTTEHILATELIRLYQFCSSTVLNDLKFRTRICL